MWFYLLIEKICSFPFSFCSHVFLVYHHKFSTTVPLMQEFVYWIGWSLWHLNTACFKITKVQNYIVWWVIYLTIPFFLQPSFLSHNAQETSFLRQVNMFVLLSPYLLSSLFIRNVRKRTNTTLMQLSLRKKNINSIVNNLESR